MTQTKKAFKDWVFSDIPVLTGEVAERFIEQCEYNAQHLRGSEWRGDFEDVYQDELFGKTYYFCLPDSPSDIVAGFTVANASIFTKRLPNARQKKNGREVHHEKGLINYPSILWQNH